MTDYTTITDGQIDAGSPLDETLLFSLRDNLVSFIEGDATAPRAPWVAMEWIETYTADNSDTYVEFTSLDSSRYHSFLLVPKNAKPNTNNRALWAQTSSNGGTSYDGGAANYSYVTNADASTDNVGILLTEVNVGNASGEDGYSGKISIFPSDGTVNNQITFNGIYEGQNGVMVRVDGGAKRNSDATVNAIRLFYADDNDPTYGTSTMVSGTITLYGLRNSAT